MGILHDLAIQITHNHKCTKRSKDGGLTLIYSENLFPIPYLALKEKV